MEGRGERMDARDSTRRSADEKFTRRNDLRMGSFMLLIKCSISIGKILFRV
jgi:hypothetical protein